MTSGSPANALQGWAPLALALAAGLLLAWFSSVTPQALPADAAAGRFSAGRALSDIAHLAGLPHPVGSAADAHVRQALVARLQGLGLSPQVQHGSGVKAWGEPSGRTWTVDNVLARLPGRDLAAPALLVMSHYDSVARSPGAADDMAGVATALELARLLKARRPARDVVFAFTDGEEAGLLGAQILLADPAFTRHVGFVVNMDVRGGGGRAMMFQTGRRAGAAARLYAAHSDRPAGDSLAAYLYEKMPNDTDFSVALAHGLPGLNYAFIGRPELYHTPAAVPAAVEPGAVQSLGDQTWAVVAPLAYAALPPSAADETWFDLFGRVVVIYPPATGWIVVALAALLLAYAVLAQRRGTPGLQATDVAVGAGQSLAAAGVAALLLYAYGRAAVHGYYPALAQATRTEAVTAMAALAASLLVFRGSGAAARPLGRWAGAVGLAWLLGVGLQLAAARTAFLAEWPTLMAAFALAAASRRPGRLGGWTAVACAALTLGFLLEFWHLLMLGVGLAMPVAGVAPLPMALAALAPLLQRRRRYELFG